MSSIMEWLGLNPPQQRAKEVKRYNKWAFPYGPAQKEKIVALLGYTGGNAAELERYM